MGRLALIAAPLVVVAAVAAIFFRACAPSLLHGEMLDSAVVTDSHGNRRLWLLTDDSFHYHVKSGSEVGSGSLHCFDCKTWTYVYDPIDGKVIKRTKTSFDNPLLKGNIFVSGHHVWVVLSAHSDGEPRVEQYDADTGERVLDTAGLVARFPELSAGIVDVSREGERLKFKTKDGREGITYDTVQDRILPKDSSASWLPLVELRNGKDSRARKQLMHVSHSETGVRSDPIGRPVYLGGVIYYQDEKCAVIIHLDQVGKEANRMLTVVDLQAQKELWTAPQEQLFSGMKIDEGRDSFSSLFFSQDDIKSWRAGDVIVLEYKNVGVMGFDYATGKRLWVVYP